MGADAVLSVERMRAVEESAMRDGVDAWELMQRAGRGAADWVARMAAGRSVAVLSGPGNNGGDGYVIAEELRARGHDVTMIAPVEPKGETAEKARANFAGSIRRSGELDQAVVVDCLFGYGLDRPVEGDFALLLEALDRSEAFKIAIDVPSSVASDSGETMGPLPHYDLTLALGAWKRAHFLMPAMARMGVKRLVPIGLDIDHAPATVSMRPQFAIPRPDSHKYSRGLLAIVAGAMPGAPLLAAKAARGAGAGYTKLLSAPSHPDAPAELV
ncbi:MAG: NAD(P)H-hydrate epimerase, partial [Erythrobacter sp.]|nr:NAD(P)H-hydrate epimerase [Erythrobacter sp.]